MRNCTLCKNIDFVAFSQGYSEMTPGCDATFRCSKKQWMLDDFISAADFREKMRSAETCRFYEEVPADKNAADEKDGSGQG